MRYWIYFQVGKLTNHHHLISDYFQCECAEVSMWKFYHQSKFRSQVKGVVLVFSLQVKSSSNGDGSCYSKLFMYGSVLSQNIFLKIWCNSKARRCLVSITGLDETYIHSMETEYMNHSRTRHIPRFQDIIQTHRYTEWKNANLKNDAHIIALAIKIVMPEIILRITV